MPDYEVLPPEEDGQPSRRSRKKPKMPSLTIERYGGRLLYVWFGMRFMTLMRLFWRGRFSFTLNCIPDTLALFIWVPWNTPLTWISEALYKKKAESLPLDEPPIFVVGHWRSGTTLLHDLFSEDPNLAYPTTYECFFPHHFLLTEGTLDHAFKVLLPKRRPQDDVPVGFDRPQEEEFAMIMLGEGSPYNTMAWPRRGPVDIEYLDFKGLPEKKVKRWADAFMWFYRRLMLKHGKRLVMKTPGQRRAPQSADQALSRCALGLHRAQPARRVPVNGEAVARALFHPRPAQPAAISSLGSTTTCSTLSNASPRLTKRTAI